MGERNYGKYVFPFPHFRKLHLLVVIIFAASFCLSFSCKESPTSAEKKIKHPREMTWTCDTLKPLLDAVQLLPENLIVLAPNDAWLVCYSDISRGLLWHWDGKTWTENNIAADVGGMRINDIAQGFNKIDIWAVGYSGDETFIGYYNGAKWFRHPQTWKGELLDVCKDPQGNIYACGRNGLVLKYDNKTWSADTIKINFNYPHEYFLSGIEYYDNKLNLIAFSKNSINRQEKYFFIQGEFNKLSKIDSFTLGTEATKWGIYGLYTSPYNELYSFGIGGYWKYINDKWWSYYNLPYQMYEISVANPSYIIVLGIHQQIFWSDGANWENISSILKINDPYFSFKNVWTNGAETFIVGKNFSGVTRTFIYHGK